ncbi:hypothetical protein PS854_04097 [Pseudomonas fluorescens]|uniref:Histidine kinase/HSP90-like ATPase domain-containing protein n=1 Tax=Pseudomonas fluorescens TaxID=294 RepID=A0A5E7MR16_PSEFL|nr:hypothetical protein PS854_04097 [Pseudomonas fluorescens]
MPITALNGRSISLNVSKHLIASFRPLLAAFAALYLLCHSACGWAEDRALDQLEHRRWTLADDSPSHIGALAQTRTGYLWLGTHDSLYRFDGFTFSRYRTPSGQDLGIVSSLLTSEDGLWVGQRNGDISLIPDGDVQPTNFNLGRGVIYALAKTPDGSLWAAANDGLMRFDGKQWQHVGVSEGFLGKNPHSLIVDNSGRLWVADEQRLYFLERGAHMLRDSGVRSIRTRHMAQAHDGTLWLIESGSENLLQVELNEAPRLARRINVGESINQLLFDRLGGLWLSTTSGGLLHVNQPDQFKDDSFATLERFSARDGLSSNFARPLLEDSEGSLWIGTLSGLDRLRSKILHPAGFPASAHNLALVADSNGSLWAGSSNLPIMRLDSGGIHYLPVQTPISATARDPQGHVWLAGPQGVWRSSGERLEKVAELPAGSSLDSMVRAMLVDQQGELWLSLNRQGLFVLREGVWQALPSSSEKPSQRMPVSASLASDGGRWFGYRDNLIVTHDKNGERRWGKNEGLDVGHVTAISHASGYSWVGGQHGLARFDGAKFQTLKLPDNRLFDNLYAIIPVPVEAGEDLWLQGQGGIFQLPASEVEQALVDSEHHIRYRIYDPQGGLANDPHHVLVLPTAVRTSQGHLWFVTRKGVVGVDPARALQTSTPPTVRIESLVVDGKTVSLTSTPELQADSQQLVINYSALSLSASDSLHFLYRLDGYDNGWQTAGLRREAIYTGLPPGEYRFRVHALNQNGVPSVQDTELDFSISPAFYRHPMFLLLAGAILLGVLRLIYRINMRIVADRLRTRLEERHGERERIARELHDTLLQGVQGLILHVQAVANSLPADQPARCQLEKALDRADQMIREGRDRVRDLRFVQHVTVDLPSALRDLEHLLNHQNIAYEVVVIGEPNGLHPVVYDELYQLAREAVNNAFRHSDASIVRVQLDYHTRQFELQVIDNGCGILADLQRAEPSERWGLKGMYERAAKIGGTLSVHSAPKQGSTVQLTLPGTLAYCQRPTRRRRWLDWKILARSSHR